MIPSKLEVAMEVERLRNTSEEGTYLNAVFIYCERNGIDTESRNEVIKLLSPVLKQRLLNEAKTYNMMKDNEPEGTSLEI